MALYLIHRGLIVSHSTDICALGGQKRRTSANYGLPPIEIENGARHDFPFWRAKKKWWRKVKNKQKLAVENSKIGYYENGVGLVTRNFRPYRPRLMTKSQTFRPNLPSSIKLPGFHKTDFKI